MNQRIEQLEQRLKEQKEHGALPEGQSCESGSMSNEALPRNEETESSGSATQPAIIPDTASQMPSPADTVKSSVVRNLLPFPVRFDMASGRVRFFGPTTSMNLLTHTSVSRSLEQRQVHWPICAVVRDLSPETHDYLMNLYWTCHNSHLHLVHQTAFDDDQERGATQFYSTFLHLAMLAVGFGYAVKGRQDIQRLGRSGSATSTLHAMTRTMAKLEMERPGGIPSIQGLSLLGFLEYSVGRDDTGWLFAGLFLQVCEARKQIWLTPPQACPSVSYLMPGFTLTQPSCA